MPPNLLAAPHTPVYGTAQSSNDLICRRRGHEVGSRIPLPRIVFHALAGMKQAGKKTMCATVLSLKVEHVKPDTRLRQHIKVLSHPTSG